MTTLVAILAVLGGPALVFVLWPLVGRGARARAFLPLPPDRRQQLEEEKRAALAALRELAFEHESGHISDEDYAELRGRYEGDAGQILTALDRLGPAERPETADRHEAVTARSAWRHPVALGAGAVLLLAFGIVLGAGIVRYGEPDRSASPSRSGMPPLASPGAGGPVTDGGAAGRGMPRQVTPEVLQGMLNAARQSLLEGQYGPAIQAYQAILKREPKNVDAMTHLGLIVAIGGHADAALETFEKALALDPNYPPALLYRGQVLYEVKKDAAGAIASWEKFLAVAPSGEDRTRVEKLIREARAQR